MHHKSVRKLKKVQQFYHHIKMQDVGQIFEDIVISLYTLTRLGLV